ncbi:MAG TPA: SDR family oxidoreductase [Waterburya sp.]|jgi:NAD(P)-dependent dehydrogenase (short-subunit alcohol dehydrogenase family)
MTFTQQQKPEQEHQQSSNSKAEMALQQNVNELKVQGNGKLRQKVALIVGGDSSLGREVALALATEEADIVIVYQEAPAEAEKTKQMIEEKGRSCLLIAGDVADEDFCQQAVKQAIDQFGKLDILVNNAADLRFQDKSENLSNEEIERTLQSNLCPMFYMTNAALPYLKEGSTIINTTSINRPQGNEQLLNYTSSKGAIMTFTRSLSQSLGDKGIRVSGVAPGPVWTMLVPSNLPADKVKEIGEQMPTTGVGSAEQIAQSVVFLASEDAPYMAGQVLFTQSMPC